MNKLSAYIAGAGKRKLSNAVIEKTKHHLLDTLAAMVSGSRLDPGKYAIKFARAQGGKAEACVIGSKLVTSAINAALANGMHAHADETDDSPARPVSSGLRHHCRRACSCRAATQQRP